MNRFLFKGIIRDKGRSLLPIVVVALGVMLAVVLYGWMKGIMGESVQTAANFNAGHLKIVTQAYAKDINQMPNEAAIIQLDSLMNILKSNYSNLAWVARIRFGALMDFPDANGETKVQGPVVGWAVDLFNPDSKEKERLQLASALQQGKIPSKKGEAIIADDFAKKFNIAIGDTFTLFGSAMDGSMRFKNFTVAGTLKFGFPALDRGAIIVDIADMQEALQMENAASEILGYFPSNQYPDEKAMQLKNEFNNKYPAIDEYAPIMLTLRDQEGMAEILDYSNMIGNILISIFIFAMAVVLWNAGILGSLRRYTEFGVRLALGESKWHIFKTLIVEAVFIGFIGSIIGTFFGLLFCLYLQEVGFDLGDMMKNATMMMPNIIRADINITTVFIGFVPGIFATVLGSALAGIGIFKRKTARLFNELEV